MRHYLSSKSCKRNFSVHPLSVFYHEIPTLTHECILKCVRWVASSEYNLSHDYVMERDDRVHHKAPKQQESQTKISSIK